MRNAKYSMRLIGLLLIGCILHSCARYSYFETPKSTPPDFQGRMLKMIFPEQPDHPYYLSNLTFADGLISGSVPQGSNFFPQNSKYIYNVYLLPQTPIPDSLSTEYQLPMESIDRIEVYDLDLGKSIVLSTLAIGTTCLVSCSIFLAFIILTKESCPFVFAYNGSEFEFTGEIYGGAIFPTLERDDYMPLPNLQPKGNEYQLRMDNLAEEIQYTNLAELQVVDHPKGTSLLVDRLGIFHTVKDPKAPLSAISGTGEDAMPLVSAKDEHSYRGDDSQDASESMDALHLKFPAPKDKANARLILKARNSIWLDYTLGQFLNMFGSKYDRWYSMKSRQKNGVDYEWSLNQGIPLSVYLKQDGAWKYLDHFPVVGPMADREMLMHLDLSGFDGDEIELKLQCGAKFWEIDYVALDSSAPGRIYRQNVGLQKAVTTEGEDVTKLLTKRDKKYFVQPKVGDSAVLSYPVPAARDDSERTVILHSRGHYKVIRKAKGDPDIASITEIRQPGKFAEFSRKNYLNFVARYATQN